MTRWICFVSQAQMQLCWVKESETVLKLICRCDIMLWGHDECAWGQKSIPGHMWPLEVIMNMHEVRGWDKTLEFKMQMKVTHAPELTSDLMHTHRDLTRWCCTLKWINSYFDFCWLGATAFLLGSQKRPLSRYWLSHTSDFRTCAKTRCWFILKNRMLIKYVKHFNLESCFELFTLFWCTLYFPNFFQYKKDQYY